MDSKKGDLKLEDAAKKFPSFIRPSLNKALVFHSIPKYPKVEEDLMASNSNGYILELDHTNNPEYLIRVWIGTLWKMKITTKLDNVAIFNLAEKIMIGIVYTWWRTPPQEDREEVIKTGLEVFEQLLKT